AQTMVRRRTVRHEIRSQVHLWWFAIGDTLEAMNYYGATDLAGSFRTVRNNTLIIAGDIGEERYNFRAAPETRTVAQLLVHLALTPTLQTQIHAVERRTTLEGFDFFAFVGKMMAEEQVPRSKAEIIAL